MDGTGALLCTSCITDARRISEAHETIRRIHFAAHGHDAPCPTCEADTELQQRKLEEELDSIIARIPFPGPRFPMPR